MRSRSNIFSTTISLIIILTLIQFLTPRAEGMIHDDYVVYPGATGIWLELQDMDEKGDLLKLTIVFKGTSSEDFIPRPIEIYIMEKSQGIKGPRPEAAEQWSFFTRKNVSSRLEVEVEAPRDGKKVIVFYNPMQEGDIGDLENETVELKIDYRVENAEPEEGLDLIPIAIVTLLIVFAVAAISMVVYYFRKRSKDAKTFFSPEEGPYYVFRSVIDDKVYYLDPHQYSQLYNTNSLDDYDFIGTASRIGGTVMPPDDPGLDAVFSTPQGEQMLMAMPVVGDGTLSGPTPMEAFPIAPMPASDVQMIEGQQGQTDLHTGQGQKNLSEVGTSEMSGGEATSQILQDGLYRNGNVVSQDIEGRERGSNMGPDKEITSEPGPAAFNEDVGEDGTVSPIKDGTSDSDVEG